jgi:hypothetical protein
MHCDNEIDSYDDFCPSRSDDNVLDRKVDASSSSIAPVEVVLEGRSGTFCRSFCFNNTRLE